MQSPGSRFIKHGVIASFIVLSLSMVNTVWAQPVDPITVDQHNCTSVTLRRATFSGSPAAYYWQTTPTGTSTVNNQLTYTVSTLGTQTIYLRATYMGSWGDQGFEVVTVYSALQAGSISSSVGSISCFNASFIINGSPASGGTGTYNTQWEYQIQGVFGWTNVANGTGQNLSVTTNYGYEYRRKVTSGICGTQYSNTIKVNTHPPFNFVNAGTISGNQAICLNTTPSTITNTASSNIEGTYTYQWQVSSDDITWNDLSGATSSSFAPGQSSSTRFYRRGIVVPQCYAKYSASTRVLVINVQQAALAGIAYNCTAATINIIDPIPTAPGYVAYWQDSPTGVYQCPTGCNTGFSKSVTGNGTYHVRLYQIYDNCWGPALSVQVDQILPPLVAGTISAPANLTCFGGSFTITGTNPTGGTGAYSYQWEYQIQGVFGWTNVANGTGQNLSVTTNYGYEYRRSIASGACAKVYTQSLILGTYPPTNALHPGGISHFGYSCVTTPPDVISSTSSANWGNSSSLQNLLSYQWQQSMDQQAWSDIAGATTESYSRSTALTQTTYFRRKVISPCGQSLTVPVTVSLSSIPSPSPIKTQQVCRGNVTLAVEPIGYGYIHYWQNTPDGVFRSQTGANAGDSKYFSQSTNETTYYVRRFDILALCWSPAVSITINLEKAVSADLTLPLDNESLLLQNENYVIEVTPLKPLLSSNWNYKNYTSKDISQTITYLDGLGRTEQIVKPGGLQLGGSLVQPIAYDNFSRESIKYLPYGDCWNKGLKKQNWSAAQTAFYNSPGDKVANDNVPYSITQFEKSPLNKVVKEGHIGEAWQPSAGHAISHNYLINGANEVLKWRYDYTTKLVEASSGVTPSYFSANELLLTKTGDENGFDVLIYKDKSDRVVLKRVQYSAIPILYADTYSVYDDFGLLRATLPPEAIKNIASQYFGKTNIQKNLFLNLWAFRYNYDYRKRLIDSKVPGTGRMFFVYDKRNRIIIKQDSAMRSTNKWAYTKYDILNRPIVSGTYMHTGTQNTQALMQDYVNAQFTSESSYYESYEGTSANHGYSNRSFPTLGTTAIAITYYDNYNFKSLLGNPVYDFDGVHLAGLGDNKLDESKNELVGLVTGSKVIILDEATWIVSVNYFDRKYRTIQTIQSNTGNGFNKSSSFYNFAGWVTESKFTHSAFGQPAINVVKKHFYDHGGRLLKITQQVDNESVVTLAEKKYNELGQLVEENLHSRGGAPFLQSIDYRYNIRGWLTDVNAAGNDDVNDLLSYELKYNQPTSKGGTSRFNGSISEMIWTASGNPKQSYGYYYDAQDRLIEAKHYDWSNAARNGRYSMRLWNDAQNSAGYDLNGNITNLKRYGQKAFNVYGLMDDMAYQYTGNQVKIVNDNASGTSAQENGFKEVIQSTNVVSNPEYSYDQNGNQTVDKNKGITATEFNDLNRVKKLTKGSDGCIKYFYAGDGTKVREEVYNNANTLLKKTDFISGFVYESQKLQYAKHEGGRAIPVCNPSGAITGFAYEYFLKDHLGNVRVTFNENTISKSYLATMERNPPQVEADEENQFRNLANASRMSVALFNHTPGAGKNGSVRLSASPTELVGPAKSFEVLAGDVFDLEVYAKYANITSTASNPLAIVGALINAFSLSAAGGIGVESAQAYNRFNSLFGAGPVLGAANWEDGNAPKAFLNYLLFDQNFILIDMGFDQISESANETGANIPHDYLNLQVKVKQRGYLYVYLSNESPTLIDVFFDDFKITSHSEVTQVNDYYPFGQRIAPLSFQRSDTSANDYLYNGASEWQNDLNINQYATDYRGYDPVLGRFGGLDPMAIKYSGWSPYNYAFNDPINKNDPTGAEPPSKRERPTFPPIYDPIWLFNQGYSDAISNQDFHYFSMFDRGLLNYWNRNLPANLRDPFANYEYKRVGQVGVPGFLADKFDWVLKDEVTNGGEPGDGVNDLIRRYEQNQAKGLAMIGAGYTLLESGVGGELLANTRRATMMYVNPDKRSQVNNALDAVKSVTTTIKGLIGPKSTKTSELYISVIGGSSVLGGSALLEYNRNVLAPQILRLNPNYYNSNIERIFRNQFGGGGASGDYKK